jgi:hypothetical protein
LTKEHSAMNTTRFDSLSKSVGRSSSRRQAIKLLGGGAVGAVAAAAGLGVAGAKRKGKKHQGERRHASGGAVNAQMRPSDGDPTEDVPPTDKPRPQHDFVQTCKASGGTSTSVGTYKVKCCIPVHADCASPPCMTAFCSTCDFHYDPPACKDTILLAHGVEIDKDVTPAPAFP